MKNVSLSAELKEREERERNKPLYEKIAQLQMLNVAGLERILAPALQSAGYANLVYDNPRTKCMQLIVPFTIRDTRESRGETESKSALRKAIEEALLNTNWWLMSEGVTYTLGVLEGRLKGSEHEEHLLEVVRKRFADNSSPAT